MATVDELVVYKQEQMLGKGLRESRWTDEFQKKAEKESVANVCHTGMSMA